MSDAGRDPAQWDVLRFVRHLRLLVEEEDCRIVWFLGAGCSVSSGIKTASGLVEEWLPRLKSTETGDGEAWESWAKEEFPTYGQDLADQGLASIYGAVIDRLFPVPQLRQREIERLTSEKDPGVGYALLAVLMGDSRFGPRTNVVVTTNFDDLMQDAIYLLTRQKPLVVVHDSLAPFARYSRNRPLVVKVHGDARLAPRNTPKETAGLGPELSEALDTVLSTSALVFLGYGGNDRSIATLIGSLPASAFPWGTYWVGRQPWAGPVIDALRERPYAFWVDHPDFDSFMLQVAGEFGLKLPSFERWRKLYDNYQQTLRSSAHQAEQEHREPEVTEARGVEVANRLSGELDAYQLVQEGLALRDDPDRADDLFRRAVEAAQHDPYVLGSAALFLHIANRDLERAEDYYLRAIDADPDHAPVLSNYALFLGDVRSDDDRAETYHRRALDADQRAGVADANSLANYAKLLFARGRQAEARQLVQEALALGPQPTAALELWFYLYAHVSDERARALDEIHRLISLGVRSKGWQLASNVERAIEDGHPDPEFLGDLAQVVAEAAGAEVLDQHEAWAALSSS